MLGYTAEKEFKTSSFLDKSEHKLNWSGIIERKIKIN